MELLGYFSFASFIEPSTDYKSNKNIGTKKELIKLNNEFPPMKLQRASQSIQQSGADASSDSKIVAKYGCFARGSLAELDQLRSLLHHSKGNPRQLMEVVENLIEKISIVKGRFLESVADFQTELYEFSCDLVSKSEERITTSAQKPKQNDGFKLSKNPFFVCVSAKNVFKEKPTLFDYICMATEIYNIQSDLQLLINNITQNQNTMKKEPPNPNESLGICSEKNRRVAVQTDGVFDYVNKNEVTKCDKAVSVLNIRDEVVKPKLRRSLTCYVNYIPPVENINSSENPKPNEEIIGYLRPQEYPKKTDSSLNSFEQYSFDEQIKYNLSRSHLMLGENSNPVTKERKKKYETNKRKEIKRKIRGNAIRLMNDYLKVKTKENPTIPLESQPSSSPKIACKTSKCNCLQAVYEVLKGCQSRKASTVTIEDTSKMYDLNEIVKKSHKSGRGNNLKIGNAHRKHQKCKREKSSLEKNQIVSATEKLPGRCDGLMQIEKLLTLSNHHEKVTISPTTSEVVHYVNDSHIVICNFPKEAKAQWIAPEGDVTTKRKGRVHVEEKQSGQLALVFEQIALADKGEWTCMIEDGAKKSFRMVINQPISFMDTAILQTAKEGKDAMIRCEVRGDPEPTVSWSFNGKSIILPHAKFTKIADGLSIKKVSKNDSGEYTCRAFQISETINEVDERVILLKIEHKPLPVEKSADVQYGYINGMVNLTCEALAEPQANFSWYRHGKKISPKVHQIFVGNHSSMLQIPIKEATAFGDYTCKATNPLGSLEKTIKLQEGTKPDPPTQFTLRGVNSDTFDIDVGAVRTSNIRDEMDINGYKFQAIPEHEWRASGGNWEKAREFKFGFEDGVTFLLNNLAPNTTYLVRVASKNLAGLSDWTETKKFTTYPKEPMITSAFNRICPFGAWDTLAIATVTTFVSSYAASDSSNILRIFHVIL